MTAVPPSAPVSAFTASPTAGNAPLTVSFTNQSTGNPTSYSWNFGDGGTSTDTNPTRTYTAAGTYTVQLTATNAGGSNSTTRTITVTTPPPPAPVAAFTPSATSGNAPLTVSFTNQSTGSPTSYSWNFGDGGTSTETNPTRTYTAAGTYTVQLTASNAGGSNTASATITVNTPPPPAPVAAFTPSATSGDAPLTVAFTNQSTGSPTSYSWNFGDGGTSTETNPTRTYTTAGTYAVQLTATNAGGSNTTSATITVNTPPPPAPVAAFIPSAISGDAPLTVSFTNQSTGNPTSYSWNFGDGDTSTETNPTRTYTAAGTYTVQLTATNAGGSNSTTKTITVTTPPPPPPPPSSAPVAAFTASPTSGNAPLMVSFTNQSTGNPTSYSWNFGDGGTSTETNPTRTYTAAGTYIVQLTATNTGGSNSTTKTITVTAPAPATLPSFARWVRGADAKDLNGDGKIDRKDYDIFAAQFGAVSGSTPPPPSALVAAFTASPTSGNAPLTVSFTNQSTGSPTSYSWSFGDGGTSTETNPTRTYTTAGAYIVQLTATNAGGSNRTTRTITVTATPGVPLTLSVTQLTMDDTDVGDTSPKTLSITNTGGRSVSVTMNVRGKDAAEFSVSPATVSIAAGRTRSFTVVFSPVSAGIKTASIEIGHNAGGNPLTVAIQGTALEVVPPVPLTLSDSHLAMDDTDVGDTTQKTFSITNTGTKSISITMSTRGKDAAGFSVSPATVSIAAGRIRSFTVTFSPVTAGVKTASIEVGHNAGGNPLIVPVQGTGLEVVVEVPLTLSVTQLTMDDTPVRGSSRKTFAINNNGTQTIAISLKTSGSAASEFSVTPASTTVIAKGSRTITVTFTPTSAGAKTAAIEISQDAGGTPLTLPVQGNGLGVAAAAPIAASVTQLTMDDTPIRATSRKTFTITNTSAQTISISLSTSGTAANEFRVAPSSATITAKGRRTITVTFAPTRTGNRTAQLSIRYGTGGDAIIVPLTGKALSSNSIVATEGGSGRGSAKRLDAFDNARLSVETYPNPFNSQTVFRYHLPNQAQVRVEIFDMLGRRVRVLIDDLQSIGDHQATWDGRNQQGEGLGSGIYLFRIQADVFSASGKLLLLR